MIWQCGQGATDDVLSPTCVSSLLGIRIEAAAAGLWHTLCISADGDVYAFGGNQFGQLGTGSEQAEVKFSHQSSYSKDFSLQNFASFSSKRCYEPFVHSEKMRMWLS